jgi:hypothetical protein
MTPLDGQEREALVRRCHDCGLPIPDDEKAIKAKTGNAWKHFECWYDGTPFPRDPQTGVLND